MSKSSRLDEALVAGGFLAPAAGPGIGGEGGGGAGPWAEKRHWGIRARTELVRWLGNTVVLPYDERVAWKWGQLSVVSERRGRGRPIKDTWIAACCLVAGLPLATLRSRR